MRSEADRRLLLRRLPHDWRVSALAATLPVAGPKEREAIASDLVDLLATPANPTLLERLANRRRRASGEKALRALVGAWDVLTDDLRAAARACAGERLPLALAKLASEGSPSERANAALAAAEVASPETIHTIAMLALESEPAVRSAVERGLADLTSGVDDLTPNARVSLDRHLAELARRDVGRRSPGVLAAILQLAERPGPRLKSWLDGVDQPGQTALRAELRRSDQEGMRARCVGLLRRETLQKAALDRLGAPATTREHEQALRRSHLLLHPHRRRALGRLPRPASSTPTIDEAASLSGGARCGLVRWIELAPFDTEVRIQRLGAFLSDEDVGVRHGAVRALADLARDEASARLKLMDFAFDADECVALTATRALSQRLDSRSMRALGNLARSRHGSVRRVASRAVEESADPQSLKQAKLALRPVPARRLLLRDRTGLIDRLRSEITTGDARGAMEAIAIARRLDVTDDLELELLAASTNRDPRVVATAVAALGEASGDAAGPALLACAAHEDARVRANAIEAIGKRDSACARILEAVQDDDARARANAIRCRLVLARDRDAESALAEMLCDERVSHRVSALWLAERAARTALAQRVASLVHDDPEPKVRERARRCGRRLLAQLRSDWSEGVVSVEAAPGEESPPVDAFPEETP